jgi:hypothetical protein
LLYLFTLQGALVRGAPTAPFATEVVAAFHDVGVLDGHVAVARGDFQDFDTLGVIAGNVSFTDHGTVRSLDLSAGNVHTVLGSPLDVDDGEASVARLLQPSAVSCNAAGLCVALDGGLLRTINVVTGTIGTLPGPRDGALLSDTHSMVVRAHDVVVSRADQLVSVPLNAPDPFNDPAVLASGLQSPGALTVRDDDDVLVAESGRVTQVGAHASSSASPPMVALTQEHNAPVFVSDDNRIRAPGVVLGSGTAPSANPTTAAELGLQNVHALVADGSGNLFVLDDVALTQLMAPTAGAHVTTEPVRTLLASGTPLWPQQGCMSGLGWDAAHGALVVANACDGRVLRIRL